MKDKIGEWTLHNYFSGSLIYLTILISCVLLMNCSVSNLPKETKETTSEGSSRIQQSNPQSPKEEKKGFNLPPGFEIELFAAEPDIGKPMNISFDKKGRLWVTQSQEYPFSAEDGGGRDKITILEDTDRDGQADVFTTFADGLNIPIGILPVENGAIGYSIPSIYHFEDSNGDDWADNEQFLYGEFEFIDTHGMVNSFARGFDEWIYACHGYRNTSEVSGTHTDSITMNSGHTFRFKKDGSAIEVTTTGRVNPFALTFDKWGYQYSSDSHSDPIYQLIPGGDYPHFGKTPTGIGFAPPMMNHEHGPTALTGVALNDMNQFPPEYKNSLFNGNVLTNKIFRDSLGWQGATPVAIHKEEFLTSEDPWFRPVDMTMGPDGALYIADFYNRIIGHYEVSLNHPGRDRHRGRIWRITYKGKSSSVTDWSTADLNSLLEGLKDSHLKTRLRVADQIVTEFGQQAVKPLKNIVENKDNPPIQRTHGLWILDRLKALSNEILALGARDPAEIVRVHTMRILGERSELNQQQTLLIDALNDRSPHVQRTAVQALARHINEASFKPILNYIQNIPDYDTHLRYATSLTLRDHLRNQHIMQNVLTSTWNEQTLRILADHMVGVSSPDAGKFILTFVENYSLSDDKVLGYIAHAVRNIPYSKQDELISLIREKFVDELDLQRPLFEIVQSAMDQRGEPLRSSARNWGVELAETYLDEVPTSKSTVWRNSPLDDSGNEGNTWVVEDRTIENGLNIEVLTSRSNGDSFKGILLSPTFHLANKISFYLHVKEPDFNATSVGNKVHLRLMQTDEIIKEIFADTEKFESRIVWDVSAYSGRPAYLEVLDESSNGHLAVGDFSQPELEVPAVSPSEMTERLRFAADIAHKFGITKFTPSLAKILNTTWFDFQARASAANALVHLSSSEYIPVLRNQLVNKSESPAFKYKLIELLGQETTPEIRDLMVDVLPEVPGSIQLLISRNLANTTAGAELLLEAANQGLISNEVLNDQSIETRFESIESQEIQRNYQLLRSDPSSGNENDKESLIEQRLAEFNPELASPTKGRQIFEESCSTCHQLGRGNSSNIGPQLDGIGSRNKEYIAEAILAPNRTVAESWRINNFKLKSGEVHSGLFQRKEGNLLVFADFEGNEISIPESQIEERTAASKSIMPDFNQILTSEEFQDLLAYLISQK